MIDPEFLAMLVCPATRQPLREASAAEVAAANEAIARGLRNRGGNPVSEALSEALATVDGAWLYPVQQGIPILLAPEAIPKDGGSGDPGGDPAGDPADDPAGEADGGASPPDPATR
jgi:uncharacterized protein YbaR (Trm112 family)